jgi:transposase
VCRRSSDGTILEEKRIRTAKLDEYLAKRQPARVIVETCTEAFAVAEMAMKLGHEVRIVPATLARALGVGARGIKTDARDARALSEVSCRMDLPSVHLPSKESRERKALCSMRDCLVSSRTRLVNAVRAWLRGRSMPLKAGSPETVAARIRQAALLLGEDVPAYLERLLVMVEQLNIQIKAADLELKKLAETDPVCVRLMSVPGVGPANAVMFKAVLDDEQRFSQAHAVESYLGLTPGERSSSNKVRRTSITKAGSSSMRRLLIQAAHVARHCRPDDPMVLWSRRVEQRRGKKVAVVALARKLAGILYALWRDGSTYIPTRSALPDAALPEEAIAMLG